MKPILQHRAYRRINGYTLYELLIVVMLTVLIGGISAPFTVRVVRSMHGAQMEATANARFDNAIDLLRYDVWQAVAIRTETGNRLLLTNADHTQIAWQFDQDRHLRQISPTRHHDWGVLSTSITFTPDGPHVRVEVADMPHFHGGTFCMVSPMMLAAEEKP